MSNMTPLDEPIRLACLIDGIGADLDRHGWLSLAEQRTICAALRAFAHSESGASKFSDFIRNATPEEKEEVYADVMKRASERQNAAQQVPGDREARGNVQLRQARPFLLRAWELSGEGALGPIAKMISMIDAELSGTPALAHSSDRRMFPIMRGPSVPWEVMAPHEHQAKRNHGQTLERLAERGGLGTGEAWCAVNGLALDFFDNAKWAEYEKKWCEFAERINLHYDELDRLRLAVKSLPSASSERLWSIRHVDGRWRTMDTIGMPDWTDDANKALAFRLREHADTFAADDPDDVRIVQWSAS